MLKKSVFFPMLWLIIYAAQSQTTYYVDAINGDDNNNGTSPSAAWQTINKVNNASNPGSGIDFSPGTTVRFKRGQTFRGQLKLKIAGVAGSPVTAEAYYDAQGNDDNTQSKPIIRTDNETAMDITAASDNFTYNGNAIHFTQDATNPYLFTAIVLFPSSLGGPMPVLLPAIWAVDASGNEIPFQSVCKKSDLTEGTIYAEYDNLSSNSKCSPSRSASSSGLGTEDDLVAGTSVLTKVWVHIYQDNTIQYRIAQNNSCISSGTGIHHIVYKNLQLMRSQGAVVQLAACNFNTLQNLRITDSPLQGITGSHGGGNHIIEYCVIDQVGYGSTSGGMGCSLFWINNSTDEFAATSFFTNNNIVRHCSISTASVQDLDHCIYDQGNFNTYYNNIFHDAAGAGIKFDNNKTSNALRDGGKGNKAYNNLIQNCRKAGMLVDEVTGSEVTDNTLINSGITDQGALWYVKNPNPTDASQNKFLRNIINGCARAIVFANPRDANNNFIEVLANNPSADYLLSDFNVFKNPTLFIGNYGGTGYGDITESSPLNDWQANTGNQDEHSSYVGSSSCTSLGTIATAPATLTNTALNQNLAITGTAAANGTLQTGDCAALLRIENGGRLEVGNTAASTLTLGAGTTVIIAPGGKLVIHNNSKVSLQNGAKLIYDKEAQIELDGNDAVLELKGALEIKDQADFTFAGSGFIRFGLPNNSPNINMSPNSKITLQGSSRTDKIAEIIDNTYLLPTWYTDPSVRSAGADARTVKLTLRNGTVLLGKDTYLNAGNSDLDFNNVTFARSGSDFHGGIVTHGWYDPLDNITVDGGTYGITGYLFGGQGSPLYISNSTFSNCGVGIYTYDKGGNFSNLTFQDNGTAWIADGPVFTSPISNSSLTGGWEGIHCFGSAGITLIANNCNINSNTNGVLMEGSNTFKARCGSIQDNVRSIILRNNSGLDSRWADVTNNGLFNNIAIRTENAYYLYINRGFNDFQPAAEGVNAIVNGTFSGLAFGSTPGAKSIPAGYNHWRSDGRAPVYNTDYLLQINPNPGNPKYPPIPVFLTDECPNVTEPCNTDKGLMCIGGGGNNSDLIQDCPGCVAITTKDFVREKLNDAIFFALKKMSEIHGCNTDQCLDGERDIIGDDRKAVDLFHQVLTFPIPRPKPEEEQLLLMAYRKMLEAISNAFLTGQIRRGENRPVFTSEVQLVMEVQDRKIAKAGVADTTYFERLYTTMEKGQVLRMADRRDVALPIFNEVLTWVKPEQADYVQHWRCLADAEEQVLTGVMTHQAFRALLEDCRGAVAASLSSSSGDMTAADDPALWNQKDNGPVESGVLIYPNPAEQELIIRTGNEYSYIVIFRNILGQQVEQFKVQGTTRADVSDWKKGVHVVEIKNEQTGEKIIKKVVVN